MCMRMCMCMCMHMHIRDQRSEPNHDLACTCRYWEARKIWGGMINKLREMARMAHTSMNGWDREHLLQLMGAFAPILLQVFRV